MSNILVPTKYGKIQVTIAGDEPTTKELLQINEIRLNPEKYLPREVVESYGRRQEGMFEGFDYKTGIRDSGLRAALSTADKPEEEIAHLARFGLTEEDYVRDPRGALALTPSGAAKFGVETDQNVVIDERGFSRADLADLAGMTPETGGAVGGAIIGQTLLPVPVLGAALGAAAGGGLGNLLEESYEALTGTSKQTAGEIAKDTAIEAALAGGAEGVVGLVARGLGIAFRGPKPGDLPRDQLTVIGESREFGISPAVGLAGANPLVARAQAISEQIFRGSPRTFRNTQAITKELENLRAVAGASDPVDLGRALMEAAKTANRSVKDAEQGAKRAVLRAIRDMSDDLGRASELDKYIDEDLFNAFKTAAENFDDLARAKFSSIDEAIKDAVGNAEVIPTAQVSKSAKDQLKKFRGSVQGGSVADTKSMLQALGALGPRASFSQIYNARKSLNDLIMANPGSNTVRQYGSPLLSQLDAVLNSSNVENALLSSGQNLSQEGIEKVRKAANSLGDARTFFKQGMNQFEEISNIANINAIRNEIKNGVRVNPAGLMDRLVKPNNPELLRRAERVLKDVRVAGYDFEGLKQRVASEWLRQNIGKAVSDLDPRKFRGSVFKDNLDKLGTTADELFGEQKAKQIRNLAEQLNATSLTNVDESVISRVQDIIGSSAPDINLLRNLAAAQRDVQEVTRNRLMRKLASENMDEMEAASLIANSGTKPDDINRIMKYFSNNNEAINKIRGYYMETMIGDFGDTFLTDPTQLKAFGKRLEKEYQTGKLKTVFGEDMANRMNKFGRVLVFNSQTVDGGGIVAGAIAASPLNNLGKLSRFFIIGKLLSSELFYRNLDKQYAAMTKGAGAGGKALALGQLIAQALNSTIAQTSIQSADEGFSEASRQAQALMNSFQQQMQEQQAARQAPSTPVPTVAPGAAPMAAPGPRMNGQASDIREQAAENPAVAASLLGGLGSAALLNR